jgi:hypothetical protein
VIAAVAQDATQDGVEAQDVIPVEAAGQAAIQDGVEAQGVIPVEAARQAAIQDGVEAQDVIPVEAARQAAIQGGVEAQDVIPVEAARQTAIQDGVEAQDVIPVEAARQAAIQDEVAQVSSPDEAARVWSLAVPVLVCRWQDVQYSVPVWLNSQDVHHLQVFRRWWDVFPLQAENYSQDEHLHPDESPAVAPLELCDHRSRGGCRPPARAFRYSPWQTANDFPVPALPAGAAPVSRRSGVIEPRLAATGSAGHSVRRALRYS